MVMIVTLYQPKFSQCWLKTLINFMKGTFFLTGYKFSLGFKRFEKKYRTGPLPYLFPQLWGAAQGLTNLSHFLIKLNLPCV